MTDPTRRRRYRYDRVVIEKARILDAQFDDAVMFFTGAQIELMRNMTEYLRRLETYCSDYHLGYYLTPTAEDYDSLMAIVANLEETLMGNPNTIWGYYDQWEQRVAQYSTGGANTYVETTPVPAGYVYKLEHWTLYHTGGITCGVYLIVNLGGSDPVLYDVPALPSQERAYDETNITLKEGDTIKLRVSALPDEEAAALYVLGYKMAVP